MSVGVLAVTVPPAGQLDSALLPLTFSRTALVQAPVQLTIGDRRDVGLASAPANVTVKPPLPAPDDVAVPVAPRIAFSAAVMLALVTARPPRPNVGRRLAVELDGERLRGGGRSWPA